MHGNFVNRSIIQNPLGIESIESNHVSGDFVPGDLHWVFSSLLVDILNISQQMGRYLLPAKKMFP